MFSVRHLDRGLPPPALASSSRSVANKRTTFDSGLPSTLRVHWSRFKKRIVASSAPSESLIEITESNTGSDNVSRRHPDSQPAQPEAQEDEEVDETVVDNDFRVDGPTSKSLTQPSERDLTPDKSGASATHATHITEGDSMHEREGRLSSLLGNIHGMAIRIAHALDRFFFTTFYDPVSEAQYKKDTYYQTKGLAFWGALFVILDWVLVCILIDKESIIFWDKIFYYVICPVFCVPLAPMILYDVPKKYPIFYQLYMGFSLWSWGGYNMLMLELCGYYTPGKAKVNCHGKEFIGVFFYTSAFPVIALFALGQNRLMATISGLWTAGFLASVIHEKNTWIRNTLNFIIYMAFLVWIHYQRENAERRLYTIRDRLKSQYRATQQAQVSERKAADSKKRFSSYIFHEVRVPLNTALLAVQNMEASGIFRKDDIEFTALEGSLTMMSKVLNDVLDFNRMDSGRFESISKPYPFHKILRSMLVPLQLAATARDLHLITELDPQIDEYVRTALYLAKGHTEEWIRKQLPLEDEEAALVVGDEHRLRQIVTNLTSNACKFTPTGGKIWVRTKLVLPAGEEEVLGTVPGLLPLLNDAAAAAPGDSPSRLSASQLRLHNAAPGTKPSLDRVVIRIEIEDTGVGIRRKDMIDNRLFSPYVQTDIGRFQGGKGTGLGLALSKQIIRLSGGRLGVKSKRNSGSTFWVELSMGVGTKVLEKQDLGGKDDVVAHTLEFGRATTEAFKSSEGEDETPSTLLSSATESSRGDSSSPSLRAPLQSNAMRELMEHSGQIELMPRNHSRGYSGNSVLSLPRNMSPVESSPPIDGGSSEPSGPYASPSQGTISDSSTATLGTAKPGRVAMPPTLYSFGSSGTSGSRATTPMTPPQVASHEASSLASSSSAAPPKPSPPPTATTPAQAQASASTATFDPPLSVLVVDDDALTRKLMSRMLTRIGCTVETAENGKTALDMTLNARNPFTFRPAAPGDSKPRKVRTPYLQEEGPKYDVIFLDNQMPVMSGVETVRRLRELKRTDFVVGVTGNALKEDQQEYLDAGVDAVLTKPVREASLRGFLHSADEKRKTKREMNDESLLNSPEPP